MKGESWVIKFSTRDFAKASFEEDKKNQLYYTDMTFDTLPTNEKDLYMEEAIVYLTGNSAPCGWPCFILEMLSEKVKEV